MDMLLQVYLQFCNNNGFVATSGVTMLFCPLLDDWALCRPGDTNVVPAGTRSPARTKMVARGHRRSQGDHGPPNFWHFFFVLWEALYLTKYCCSLNVKTFGPKKISGWLRNCPPACFKNNISMISVFTLQNILIVNTEIFKGYLSNTFISEVWIKLVALRINPHARKK